MGLITSLPAAQGVFHPLGKALLSRNWHFPPTNKNQAGLWVAVGTGVASGPPAQIRAGGITALGSYLEFWGYGNYPGFSLAMARARNAIGKTVAGICPHPDR